MNKEFALDLFGIVTAVAGGVITIVYGKDWKIGISLLVAAIVFTLILIFFAFRDYRNEAIILEDDKAISEIILLNEENKEIVNWDIMGKTSLLIGREKKEVDIDLSNSLFAGMVEDKHAILNYVDGDWYIEDLDSKNGTQISDRNVTKLYNIKDGQSKLSKGDYIYIGLNKLQIR
jgi:hypothetical protein